MVPRVARRLGQLLDRDLRRRHVRVAEPEVDHVLAGPPGCHLERVDLGEGVRRQGVDASELHIPQLYGSAEPYRPRPTSSARRM